jgi:hypothetical protein
VGDRGGSLERDLARTTFFGTLSDAFTTCTLHNSNRGFFRHYVIAASSEHSATGVTHQLHCVWHCRLTHCRISQPVRTPQLQRYQKCQLLLISCRPGIRIAFLVLRTSPPSVPLARGISVVLCSRRYLCRCNDGQCRAFWLQGGCLLWSVDELPAPLPVVWPFCGFSDISVLCAEFQASCTHSAFGMRCCVLSFWRPFQQLGGLLGV